MVKKKRKLFGSGKIARYRIFNFILALMLLAAFINVFTSIELIEKGSEVFKNKALYLIFEVVLIAIGLFLVAVLSYILHFGFGAISRMEKILENVASGDYSLRMYLRNKDILRPLAGKVNKIIELLEEESENDKK